MGSTLESIPTHYNQAIQKLEKSCELTALLRSHLGVVLKDDMDSQFGYMFEEISQTLALSREIILTKSDRNMLGSKVTTLQLSEGARTNKRKREDKPKDSQRRKCNNKRTELTPMPDHDGYHWRKYGQKNILHQRYPRCYYRCTYHHDLNCMAAKQVQQYNDENPPLFEVTYFDEHTCNISPRSEPTINHNILDFSGKQLPESYLSSEYMCRRQEEEATLVSCLTDVIRGYNSTGISENSFSCSAEVIRKYNGGTSETSNEEHNQLKNSNASSITIDDDATSIESTILRVDDFPVVHGITLDPDWLEQDNTQFLFDSFPLI